ncbi:hypothetical protein KH5_04450 [Urechidicola sp. KH5]
MSNTHFIPPLTAADETSSQPGGQYIYISTPSTAMIEYTIKPLGQPSTSWITGLVSNTTPQEVFVGNGFGQLFVDPSTTSTVQNDKGYFVEANSQIYVSVRVVSANGAQAGALVSKGNAALGYEFRIGAYTNENGTSNYLSFASILATEDNTIVEISDISNSTEVDNFTGIFPLNLVLDEGETYTIAMNSFSTSFPTNNKDGLIGGLIQSDKPIVVNSGSANGSFHNGNSRDYGFDQITGANKIGDEYILVKGDGNDNWENVLVVGHYDNTDISINGNFETTINAGDYYLIEGDRYSSNGNMFVNTSQNVFVYQGIGATNGEANQGMFFVPPLSCETRGILDNIAQIDDIGSTNFDGGITIVSDVGATITINGSPISSFNTFGPFSVTGNLNYETYKVLDLTGNITVQTTGELYCSYFNYDGAASSGGFYSGFPTAPEINFDTAFVTLGNCIPNVELEVGNDSSFDSVEWFFDDGTGYVSTGNTGLTHTPTLPGNYKLVGYLNCSGLVLESQEVPVSICPDDTDNDGIPDNIDIDNDNDGILNCIESNGNQIIDLTDPLTGTIPVGGYTYSGNIQTVGNTSATPIAGNNLGLFVSTIPSNLGTTESSVEYQLQFNNPLHLELTYAPDNSIGGDLDDLEEFQIQVPSDRTITLEDPDDQLLVDTNYDGVYETGITQISGFDIRVKLNGTSIAFGSTTFRFRANTVTEISIKHINLSDTSSNEAAFQLTATCLPLDSDLDGIEDAFDLDAENDGIPDTYEFFGVYYPLSGVDVNQDGLDDIFPAVNVGDDFDGDVIPNYLDIDSDNDGIYDLYESGGHGSHLSDTDWDGVVDSPVVGTNGLVDLAETTPDSGIIDYSVLDSDGDAAFDFIDSDSDGDECPDVNEAGFSDANEDLFLGDVPPLVNTLGKVTNASDGYTLPNTDYATAALIDILQQPENQNGCNGLSVQFDIDVPTAETFQWEESLDGGVNWNTLTNGGNYSGTQTSSLMVSNLVMTDTGKQYRVFLTRTGNSCGLYSNPATIEVFEQPTANMPPPIILCDDNNDGNMLFDLTIQTALINATPGMTVTYHETMLEADSGANPITTYTGAGGISIYARVSNDLNIGCYTTTSFGLELYDSPFPTDSATITPLQMCDDVSVGAIDDGFVITDLTQKEIEILNGQSNTTFNLSYYTDSGFVNLIIDPINFQNTVAGGQTIYVQMENINETSCVATTSFELDIFEQPAANMPPPIILCDDNNDGSMLFDLTVQDAFINSTPGMTVTYHLTMPEADSGANPITTYTGVGGISIYARVSNDLYSLCYATTSFGLELYESPFPADASVITPIEECDNTSFGSDTDGIITVDLTQKSNEILNGQNALDFTLTYFTDAGYLNQIPNPSSYSNSSFSGGHTIFVRMNNNLEPNCFADTSFELVVFELPTLSSGPYILEQCDDDFDGFNIFNLTEINEEIINNITDETFTYYESNADALSGSDPITNELTYQNKTVNVDADVWVRVENSDGCFRVVQIELVVKPSAIPSNFLETFYACDDGVDTSDDIATFDFSSVTAQIEAIFPIDITVHYYENEADATSEVNEIPDPSNYMNTSSPGVQEIWVRADSEVGNDCLGNGHHVTLIVEPVPQFEVIPEATVCLNLPPITLETFNAIGVYDYEWANEVGAVISTDPTAEVSSGGVYTVVASYTSSAGICYSDERTITVSESVVATITPADITIVDDSDNNTITIDTANLGIGDYEFALDDGNGGIGFYQDEPYFDNVAPGVRTIYVNDKNNCGVAEIEVAVIGFPKFFTPNNDGQNDVWKIQGITPNFFSSSQIHVFDRFGKLLASIDPDIGWDGIYNGEMLPSTDYWFTATLTEQNGNVRVRKGNFSLIRR